MSVGPNAKSTPTTLCGSVVDHAQVTVPPGATVTRAGDHWFAAVAPMVALAGLLLGGGAVGVASGGGVVAVGVGCEAAGLVAVAVGGATVAVAVAAGVTLAPGEALAATEAVGDACATVFTGTGVTCAATVLEALASAAGEDGPSSSPPQAAPTARAAAAVSARKSCLRKGFLPAPVGRHVLHGKRHVHHVRGARALVVVR